VRAVSALQASISPSRGRLPASLRRGGCTRRSTAPQMRYSVIQVTISPRRAAARAFLALRASISPSRGQLPASSRRGGCTRQSTAPQMPYSELQATTSTGQAVPAAQAATRARIKQNQAQSSVCSARLGRLLWPGRAAVLSVLKVTIDRVPILPSPNALLAKISEAFTVSQTARSRR